MVCNIFLWSCITAVSPQGKYKYKYARSIDLWTLELWLFLYIIVIIFPIELCIRKKPSFFFYLYPILSYTNNIIACNHHTNIIYQTKTFQTLSIYINYIYQLYISTIYIYINYKAWGGKEDNIEAGQKALLARAQANSEAQQGKYESGSQPSADGTLFVKGYKY